MMVNNRPYTKLAQVGKGGSSKVYKVLASNSRVLALKKVSFENADQSTVNGYVNEIKLLRRMAHSSRIIRLWDAEVNHAKGYLSLVNPPLFFFCLPCGMYPDVVFNISLI